MNELPDTEDIHTLAKKGWLKEIKIILERKEQQKVDIATLLNSQENPNQQTPLHVALAFKQDIVAEYLIEKGTQVLLKDKIGRIPLYYAARNGNLRICQALLQKGSGSLGMKDSFGDSILHVAIQKGSLPIISLLLKQDSLDINAQNNFGETCLHTVARNGNLELAQLLINHGARSLESPQGKPMDLVTNKPSPLHDLLVRADKANSNVSESASTPTAETSPLPSKPSSSSLTKETIANKSQSQEEATKETKEEEAKDTKDDSSASAEVKEDTSQSDSTDAQVNVDAIRLPNANATSKTRRGKLVRKASYKSLLDLDDSGFDWQDNSTRMMATLKKSIENYNIEVDDQASLEEVEYHLSQALATLNSTIEDISMPEELQKAFEESARALDHIPPPAGAHPVIATLENMTEFRIVANTDRPVPMKVEGFFEPFRTEFFGSNHLCYCTEQLFDEEGEDEEAEKESAVVIIKKSGKDGKHNALLMSKWGYANLSIPQQGHGDNSDTAKQGLSADEYFRVYLDELWGKDSNSKDSKSRTKGHGRKMKGLRSITGKDQGHKSGTKGWYKVEDAVISAELLSLEAHLGRGKCYCIGVVYSKSGQTSEVDMYNNTMSPSFENFLNIIGEQVQILGWDGYRGGFDTTCDKNIAYYTSWRGFEIMFHVVPLMSQDQTRRMVGNDKVMLYYQEETPFHPQFRGNVNSVGIVAQPCTTADGKSVAYRIGCYARARIKNFNPSIPTDPIDDKRQLRDLIITLALNGMEATEKSPPYVFLYASVWKDAVDELVKKYPNPNTSHKKAQGKSKSKS